MDESDASGVWVGGSNHDASTSRPWSAQMLGSARVALGQPLGTAADVRLRKPDYLARNYPGSSGGPPRLKVEVGHTYREVPLMHALKASGVAEGESHGQYHPDARVLCNVGFTVFVREVSPPRPTPLATGRQR